MKKIALIVSVIVLLASFFLVYAGSPESYSVGITSVKVMSERGIGNARNWATGTTYIQGAIVKSSGIYYMNLTNGVAGTTAPTGTGDVSDGTNTWRYTQKSKRNGMTIVNDGSGTVYLSVGQPAVVNAGIRLNAGGGSFSMDNGSIQSAFYAISDASTNNLTLMQW